jgi:hypothetical protein
MEPIFGRFDGGKLDLDLHAGQSLVGGNMGMRGDVVLGIGAYAEAFGTVGRAGLMGEETELCDRAVARSLCVTYVADAAVTHALEVESLKRREYLRRMYRFGRSMSLIRGPNGVSPPRKAAAAAKRIVTAPFGAGLEQLGSAAFELGSARS